MAEHRNFMTTIKKKGKSEDPTSMSRKSVYRSSSVRYGNDSTGTLRLNTSRSLDALNCITEKKLSPEIAYDKYQNEYYTYIVRCLQADILKEDSKKKSEMMNQSLVSLKKEYEDTLTENVRLKKELEEIQTYSQSIVQLDKQITDAKKTLGTLKANKFKKMSTEIINALEIASNQLKLTDVQKEVIEKAFADNTLGSNSEIYKMLEKIHEHVKTHKDLFSDIAKDLAEIEALISENQELRRRCIDAAKGSLSKSIEANYANVVKTVTKNPVSNKDISENSEDEAELKPTLTSTPANQH